MMTALTFFSPFLPLMMFSMASPGLPTVPPGPFAFITMRVLSAWGTSAATMSFATSSHS